MQLEQLLLKEIELAAQVQDHNLYEACYLSEFQVTCHAVMLAVFDASSALELRSRGACLQQLAGEEAAAL